jgi:hypothetical protein
MHQRWFADRVSAQWIPFEFIDAISNAAATATERLQQPDSAPGSDGGDAAGAGEGT